MEERNTNVLRVAANVDYLKKSKAESDIKAVFEYATLIEYHAQPHTPSFSALLQQNQAENDKQSSNSKLRARAENRIAANNWAALISFLDFTENLAREANLTGTNHYLDTRSLSARQIL